MPKEDWHLSKSVPITFILTIIGQTVMLVWFIASLSYELQATTRDVNRHAARIENLEVSVQSQAVTMARMDENLQAIRKMIEDATNEVRR